MENSTPPVADQTDANDASAANRLSALSSLLENLDEVAHPGVVPRSRSDASQQNQLVQVRLGLASSLFYSLRAKHAPTAAHCLRVALSCSSWTMFLDVDDQQRDEIEVAALLHDIGKIGVPDHVLLKPGKLSSDEVIIMERHHQIGREILAGCCASQSILDIVHYAAAWYDGRKPGYDRSGDKLPLGSRLIAILDAYDAMTTDHVYRRAMSRERAIAELFECAGEQFDPQLVKDFANLLNRNQVQLKSGVARRWLDELNGEQANSLWRMGRSLTQSGSSSVDALFYQKLLDSLHDSVMFVDTQMQILLWNRAAERMTGIPAASVTEKQWTPMLIDLQDERERTVTEEECPLAHTLESGVQNKRRLSMRGRGNKRISVDAHMVPVIGRDGTAYGATLVLHDASSQVTLEERVQTLHQKATRDPLTKVANRAEFDRVLKSFVETHLEQGCPCSLIICDVDRFKRINDNYGHQAGDEALVSFASLLRRSCRPGDLVARYGGEEFVMLCADCDNNSATERAEEIRGQLADIPQPALDGKCMTASFGVTEIQLGDTPETMLRRSDRALLQAKDYGRNRVVQLGSGISKNEQEIQATSWFSWLQSATPDKLLEQPLVTAVPLKVAVEKLRGFVADHHAEIMSIDDNTIVLKIDGPNTARRNSDRPVPFFVTLGFEERRIPTKGREDANVLRTVIQVSIRPKRNRDRRREDALERARQLLFSLKSYLMAHDFDNSGTQHDPKKDAGVLEKAKSLFGNIGGSQ